MSLLQDTIRAIQAPSAKISSTVRKKLQVLLEGDTPQLGKLLPLLCRYLDMRGCLHPELPQKATVICCADHGVACEDVSAYPPETTAQMTRNSSSAAAPQPMSCGFCQLRPLRRQYGHCRTHG